MVKGEKRIEKLTLFEAATAMFKSLIGLSFVIVPSAFTKGGYLFSPFAMAVSATITTYCFVRIVNLAKATDSNNYQEMGRLAFGRPGFVLIEWLILAGYFSFIISHQAYIYSTLISITEENFTSLNGTWVRLFFFALITGVYYYLSLFRKIEKFQFANNYGTALALIVAFIISLFAIAQMLHPKLVDNDGILIVRRAPFAIDPKGVWTMVSISIYMFEAIPNVVPIMRETENTDNYSLMTGLMIGVVVTFHTVFSLICFFGFGTDTNYQMVTEMLP